MQCLQNLAICLNSDGILDPFGFYTLVANPVILAQELPGGIFSHFFALFFGFVKFGYYKL